MLFMYFAVLQNPEDEHLFEEFYNKFYDTMFYIAKGHLHTKESAEDCAQEVMFNFANLRQGTVPCLRINPPTKT